jgi:hypothetical protein
MEEIFCGGSSYSLEIRAGFLTMEKDNALP